MSAFSKMNFRPIEEGDVERLDKIRWQYQDADLELVHGWSGEGIETAVAEKDGKIFSLTGKLVAVIDPFIHDADARPLDTYAAVVGLERILAYKARTSGALEAYIAVPKHLEDYIDIVKRSGYEVTCQNCVILRRALVPETHKRLGEEREKMLAQAVGPPAQEPTEK